MSSIFLSHSSRDHEASDRLKNWLASQGHKDVFLDFDPQDGIPAGRNWERELYTKLRTCRAVIVLCSEHSMSSKWCFVELTHARSLGKHIFPVKIADCEIDPLLQDLQILDLTNEPDEALERLGRGLKAAGVDATDPLDWDTSRPPYPGLLAFQEDDAAVFFGRDQEIGQGLDLVNQMRRYGGAGLLLLLGGSGSGKSSLMRAGMLPRLRRDAEQWLVLDPFRPGDDPMANLATSLAQALERAGQPRDWREIRDHLEAGADREEPGAALVEMIRNLPRDSGHPDATVLLFIDQFEELLGQSADHPGHRFLGVLRSALASARAPLLGVATLRSDFLGTFQKHGELRALPFRDLSLAPVPHERRIEIIKKPAEKAGIDLDDTLVQALLEDTEAEDALPLLAFTLRELWELWRKAREAPHPSGERRPDPPLGLSDYRDRLGGLEGSVARAAKGVMASRPLEASETETLRGAFLGMVRVDQEGHFARRAIGWSHLSEEAHEWLERFVDARLLAARGGKEDGTVEVAHEALFEAWDQLANWLAESREALLLQHELSQGAALWNRGGRSEEDLWKGGRLHRAVEVRDLAFDRRFHSPEKDNAYSGPERRKRGTGSGGRLPVAPIDLEFLAAAELAEERARQRRRKRRIAVIATSLAVAAISFSLFLWALWERRRTEIQASRVLAQQAYTLRDRLDLALLLTLEASQTRESLESRTSLLSLLGPYSLLETILDRQDGRIHELAISPEGDLLAAAGDDGAVRVFDLETGLSRDLASSLRTFALAFSPDGDKLVSAGTDEGDVRLWDIRTGSLRRTLTGDSCPPFEHRSGGWDTVYAAAFDPMRRTLATTDGEGLVRIWDEGSGACLHQERGHDDAANALAFGPRGELLASGSNDGTVLLWDVSRGLERGQRLPAHDGRVLSLDIDPAGRTLASSGSDGRVRLWDLTASPVTPRAELDGGEGSVESVAFSPDGRRVAAAGSDGLVRFWDPETGAAQFRLPGHPLTVTAVAFGSGDLLGTASGDGTVRLWKARAGGLAGLEITGHKGKIHVVELDPAGRTAASGGADKTVRIWDLESGALRWGPLSQGHEVSALAYSANGSLLASGDRDGGVRLWDVTSGKEVPLRQAAPPDRHYVWELAFDPEGRRLAAGCAAAHLLLWDLSRPDGPLVLRPRNIPPGQDRVRSLAFHGDGARLQLAAGAGPTVQFWDLSACTDTLVSCESEPTTTQGEERSEFMNLAFDREGRTIFGGEASGLIRHWEVGDGGKLSLLAGLRGHESSVRDLLLDPDGRFLFSASSDRLVRYWDLRSGQLVFELRGHADTVQALALVRDHLLSADGGGSIRSWNYGNYSDLDALRRRACEIANRDLSEEEWNEFIGVNKPYRATCGRTWSGLPSTPHGGETPPDVEREAGGGGSPPGDQNP